MFFMMLAVLITGCSGSEDTKEDTQTDGNPYANFDHTKRVADSLYSSCVSEVPTTFTCIS